MIAHGRPGPPNRINPASLVGYDRIIFMLALGIAFLWFGLYYFRDHGPNWFLVVLGAAFFLFGISQFFMTRKFRKQFQEKKDQ